jgi:uncharacterized protein (TIGR02001 family)
MTDASGLSRPFARRGGPGVEPGPIPASEARLFRPNRDSRHRAGRRRTGTVRGFVASMSSPLAYRTAICTSLVRDEVAREMLRYRALASLPTDSNPIRKSLGATMKRTLFALAAVASVVPSFAQAQAATPAASPLTGNLTLTTDYRFRGISQSYKLPAIQGGLDWAHDSGFYLGNWNSSVSGNQFPNGASLEMDFYGGYKFPIGSDITLDVGALYYYYPGAFYSGFAGRPKYDNFELYLGGVMGPFSAKVFFAVSDFFGLDETTGGRSSKGSYYVDLNYTTEIAPRLTLGAHVGYQNVRGYSDLSYVDYKLGVTYDWTGWLLGAAIVGTDADKNLYFAVDSSGRIKRVGEPTVILTIGKTF